MGIKTKTVCVKKQRKQPSKAAAAAAASEQHDAESGDGEGDILAVREGEDRGGGEERGAISMESMVCLPDPATTPLFHEAIARLKYGNYKQAEDSLLKIIR